MVSTRNSSVLWHFILYSSEKGQFPRTPPETVQFCGILFFIHPKKGSSPELHQFSSVAFYSLFILKRAVAQRQHLVMGGPMRAKGEGVRHNFPLLLQTLMFYLWCLHLAAGCLGHAWTLLCVCVWGGGGSVMPECFYSISCWGEGGHAWVWEVSCVSIYVHVHSCYAFRAPLTALDIAGGGGGHAWVFMFMFILVIHQVFLDHHHLNSTTAFHSLCSLLSFNQHPRVTPECRSITGHLHPHPWAAADLRHQASAG